MDSKLEANPDLSEVDTELFALLKSEKRRQTDSIVLIASENFASRAVMQALGSSTSNKYSEGMVGARYYSGNEYIDQIETLAIDRALRLFKLDPAKWGCNVQALSGSPANLAVYTGVVGQHGRIMGLDLPDGGHLTHGFQSAVKKVSATSLFFESMPYKVDPVTGLIDYDALQKSVSLFRPKLIIAGFSCYSRTLDWARFRKIADSVNAYFMADIAHIAGLVAAGVISSPFEHCDIVTTTTHKTLRGPRGALIFFRRGVRSKNASGVEELYDLERKINESVFPGLQGGPHNNNIAAIAVALHEGLQPSFVDYQRQILRNCQVMCEELEKRGYSVFTGGSENHLLLLDLRQMRVDGATVDWALERCNISVNKNAIPGDPRVLRPFGIRIGTPAMTSRGMKEDGAKEVVGFIDDVLKVLVRVRDELAAHAPAPAAPAKGKKEAGAYTLALKELRAFIEPSSNANASANSVTGNESHSDGTHYMTEFGEVQKRVLEFARRFPIPGLEDI